MDHSSIPTCALYRNTGTVIVRLKMEVGTSSCKRTDCPASGCPDLVQRPSGCEHCARIRLNSQYSDCDSDILQKCRPYRSSAARSSKRFFFYLLRNIFVVLYIFVWHYLIFFLLMSCKTIGIFYFFQILTLWSLHGFCEGKKASNKILFVVIKSSRELSG